MTSETPATAAIRESLLPEFDHEMANTRKTLERVQDEVLGWKPHEKSFSMGELATHIANVPGWATLTITSDSFDMCPGGEPMKVPPANSREEILKRFDEALPAARTALASATDEHLQGSWSLLENGKAVLTMPRVAVLRSFVMNHIIHHRAHLGLYLRMKDIPVPALYGPSADEQGM
jgi:uncharacterized damage-inducible protein DinB